MAAVRVRRFIDNHSELCSPGAGGALATWRQDDTGPETGKCIQSHTHHHHANATGPFSARVIVFVFLIALLHILLGTSAIYEHRFNKKFVVAQCLLNSYKVKQKASNDTP